MIADLARRSLLCQRAWLLLACAVLGASAGQARADLDVGLVAPLTGPYARLGQWMLQAGQDSVAAINSSGGIGGTKVALRFYDDKCEPRMAAMIAERFAHEGIIAVVGHCPAVAQAVRPIYERARIPLFMPNTTWRDLGGNASQYVFHVGVREDRLGEATYRLMDRSNTGKRIAVMSDRSRNADEVTANLKLEGGNVVFELDLRRPPPARVLKEQLANSRADSLVIATLNPHRALPEIRVTTLPVFIPAIPTASNESWEMFWQSIGRDASRVRVVAPRNLTPATEIGAKVLDAWRRRTATERLSREHPPAAYAATVSAFEIMSSTLNRIAKTRRRPPLAFMSPNIGSLLAQELRGSPQPTVLGPLRSGEVGEVKVPYVLHPSTEGWAPAGSSSKLLTAAVVPPPPPPPSRHTRPPKKFKKKNGSPPETPKLAIKELPSPGVFWNSWMERDGSPVTKLAVGKYYLLNVDLSRYGYRTRESAGGHVTLVSAIKNARELKQKTLKLTVRPFVSGLTLPDGDRSQYLLDVDVEKLSPPDKKRLEADRAVWADFVDSKKSVAEISRLFRAAHLSIRVFTNLTGCGQIALSIWDEHGIRPLDHIVYTVAVGSQDACGVGTRPLVTAGFSTLLETLPNPKAPPSRPDAAIHIFELPGNTGVKAIALLVDATPIENNKAPVVYSWPIRMSVSDYMTDKQNLLRQLNHARRTGNYSHVARELKERLFGGAPSPEAAKAIAALQRITDGAKDEPFILARITSLDGEPLFLPLSLLSGGQDPLLARHVTVVHPALVPPSAITPPCVEPWTFAVPTLLAKHQGEVISEPDNSWILNRRRGTHKELRAYLSQPDPPPSVSSRPGEGLLLLAHQDRGYVWFDDEFDRIPSTYLTRTFPPGSVAILGACSFASPTGDNMGWLNQMSIKGVNTIFASPFPVPLEYGVQLTRSFIHQIRIAKRAKKTPTIAELFDKASDDAVTHLRGVSKDIQNEFVLIGDPDIRLCKQH